MTGDCHVRFCESRGVRFPPATHQDTRRSPPGSPAIPASTCTTPPPTRSWLNQVERCFALLTDKQLRRGAHRSVAGPGERHPRLDHQLERQPKPFTWTKTADEILERLASYIQRIPGAAH